MQLIKYKEALREAKIKRTFIFALNVYFVMKLAHCYMWI